ncbi:SDR family NAD(P)-dependent oxidoreductase [Chloroflexota bacterium]
MNLEGKVAIVTGAASGIGGAIALKLVKEGARVVIADIDIGNANRVLDEIKAIGSKAIAMEVDVTKKQDTDKMAKTTLNEFGEIDILANNAGGSARERRQFFHKSTEDVWDFIIDLNLMGVLNCSRAVINHMMERRYGKIINIASINGMIGSTSGNADYCAAKAGVIGFTKALAKEMGSYGINVNSVSPGYISTRAYAGRNTEELEELKNMVYLGRFGQPEDVANMVAYFASDEASYITGQNIAVCGGRSLG